MLKKGKRVSFFDPIFYARYWVQRGGTKESAVAWYCRKIGKPTFEVTTRGCDGHFASYEDRGGVLWFCPKAGAGIITHETLHATQNLFSHLDAKLDNNAEEIFAYYQQWLTKEIVRRLWG